MGLGPKMRINGEVELVNALHALKMHFPNYWVGGSESTWTEHHA